MKKIVALLITLCLITSPALAAKKLSAELSEDFVGVREGFDGARLTVFGVLRNKADVVIVLEGPPAEMQVRKKERHTGIWINGTPRIIRPAPSYYAVISSKPVTAVATTEAVQTYGLAPQAMLFADTPYGSGLVEAKTQDGLYRFEPDGVRVLESNLFRADFFLPPNVPIGLFKAHIYEFSGKKLIASRTEELKVAQIGFNDSLSRMAREKPLLYALMSLLISLGIGGGSAYLFRRVS
ncbi:MAG: hypothetical protein EOM37_07020 [Proteobacteria bacterium]|jgi:uncharacterized protein (TIGR02186 family)|nr:TIGR02186 family protein [Alphaproteobacteria bacterium]NCC03780.1 hypothetical protein [Pseudomonadota bacterium]